ncbi:hypothetical protein TIFTF001_024992 [Ficus carica]|uniref:Uncharacterized protein n=1 Tax=Ficus carica TaxID=3494 RepID=A0AA88AMZ8_FICCA|nr:hypothetical protein TIFTF001_024992 [Ficus carica]
MHRPGGFRSPPAEIGKWFAGGRYRRLEKKTQTSGAQGIEYIRFQCPENLDLESTDEGRPKAHGEEKWQTTCYRGEPDGGGQREKTSGGEVQAPVNRASDWLHSKPSLVY